MRRNSKRAESNPLPVFELRGIWMTQNKLSKFWLSEMTELSNHGFKEIFIDCVDGLTVFPEAIETVFPQTRVQLYILLLTYPFRIFFSPSSPESLYYSIF